MANPVLELKVFGIKIQKDEYRGADGKAFGETTFWQSQENEAEVLQFKRAKVICQLTGPNIQVDFELIVSLRAGFIRVRLKKTDQGHSAKKIAELLQIIFSKLHHIPGYDPMGAFNPIFSKDPKKYKLCKTYDSHWLVATLHEIKDEKGMSFEVQENKFKAIMSGVQT